MCLQLSLYAPQYQMGMTVPETFFQFASEPGLGFQLKIICV